MTRAYRGNKNNDIDVGLSVLCAVTPPGYTWTHKEIAEFCGCSWQYIFQLEKSAIEKLQRNQSLHGYSL